MLQSSLIKHSLQQRSLAIRRFSSSSSYHSLSDHATYIPERPVQFTSDKLAVFDSTTTKERRYAPFELKEITFKNAMGFAGTMVWDHLHPMGLFTEIAAVGWVLNWAWSSWKLLGSTVRLVELHKDGKHVTVHPKIGSAFTVKISSIQKLRHEKTLVETYEEAYLFPIEIAGKGIFHLHGNGQESIR